MFDLNEMKLLILTAASTVLVVVILFGWAAYSDTMTGATVLASLAVAISWFGLCVGAIVLRAALQKRSKEPAEESVQNEAVTK